MRQPWLDPVRACEQRRCCQQRFRDAGSGHVPAGAQSAAGSGTDRSVAAGGRDRAADQQSAGPRCQPQRPASAASTSASIPTGSAASAWRAAAAAAAAERRRRRPCPAGSVADSAAEPRIPPPRPCCAPTTESGPGSPAWTQG